VRVAAVEEEADEPRADEAAAARHADEVAARRAAAVPGRRHLAPVSLAEETHQTPKRKETRPDGGPWRVVATSRGGVATQVANGSIIELKLPHPQI